MNIEAKRSAEVEKYAAIYGATSGYTMNERRRKQASAALDGLLAHYPNTKTLLDVGCGDGQWMQYVSDVYGIGCVGVDPVPKLAGRNITTALATSLPFADQSVDVITCLDVMEHLVPEDTELALGEMARIVRFGAVVTVSNIPSFHHAPDGSDLHINIRPYDEWQTLLSNAFGAAKMLNDEGANRVFIV